MKQHEKIEDIEYLRGWESVESELPYRDILVIGKVETDVSATVHIYDSPPKTKSSETNPFIAWLKALFTKGKD